MVCGVVAAIAVVISQTPLWYEDCRFRVNIEEEMGESCRSNKVEEYHVGKYNEYKTLNESDRIKKPFQMSTTRSRFFKSIN